ncbi:hypothetical protein D3C71_1720770 [compost metagenome]
MGFIENEQRPGPEFAQQVTKPGHVCLVGQHAVRNQEPRTDAPGIGRETSRSARLQQVLAIDDREIQTELLGKLILPLKQHRRWSRNDDHFHPTSEKKFTNDEASLNRFAETDVIGDHEVYTRQVQGFG